MPSTQWTGRPPTAQGTVKCAFERASRHRKPAARPDALSSQPPSFPRRQSPDQTQFTLVTQGYSLRDAGVATVRRPRERWRTALLRQAPPLCAWRPFPSLRHALSVFTTRAKPQRQLRGSGPLWLPVPNGQHGRTSSWAPIRRRTTKGRGPATANLFFPPTLQPALPLPSSPARSSLPSARLGSHLLVILL